MSAQFTINFRREVYQREKARARARVLMLGVWVAYFGVMAVILGLYGLNAVSYARRTGILERQAKWAEEHRGGAVDWTPTAEDLGVLTGRAESLASHRDVLLRLARLLPANVRLDRLSWNSDGSSGAGAKKLVLAGDLRPESQDRMSAVVQLVSMLSGDSTFSSTFRNVKLASTAVEEASGVVAFVIECQ